MPCDTIPVDYQGRPINIERRKAEVSNAIAILDAALKKRKVKPVVGPQGAITFAGDEWAEIKARSRLTDACAYRRIMATGSALAKAEIARAEQMAGRSVDRKVLAAGIHSHDGGRTWGGH